MIKQFYPASIILYSRTKTYFEVAAIITYFNKLLSEPLDIVFEAVITTFSILCFLAITTAFAAAGYYLAAPLGYLALRPIGLAWGQTTPPTRKETRWVGVIFVGLTIFIILLFRMIEPDFAVTASTMPWVWASSQLMWFNCVLYLDVGLRAVLITGMLSAVVTGVRWAGML